MDGCQNIAASSLFILPTKAVIVWQLFLWLDKQPKNDQISLNHRKISVKDMDEMIVYGTIKHNWTSSCDFHLSRVPFLFYYLFSTWDMDAFQIMENQWLRP